MARYTGTDGRDSYGGTEFADFISGLGDHDLLSGGQGSDRIFGGDGNDVLSSGRAFFIGFGEAVDDGVEADRLEGGAGNDALAGGWNDVILGGDGLDVLWLDLRGATAGVKLDFTPVTQGRNVRNGSGLIGGVEAYAVIYGSAFDDDIRAGDLRTYSVFGGGIHGGAGNDRIDGGAYGATTNNALYARRLDGGAGDDVVFGSEQSDTLIGGDGNDVLTARGGSDSVYAGSGDDLIDLRGFGSDRADGGAGADTLLLDGSRSDWTLSVSLSDGNSDGATELSLRMYREQLQPNGASGRELTLLDLERFRFDDRAYSLGQMLAGHVIGTDGDDMLTPGRAGYAGVRVTDGDDIIYGSRGDDVIDGGAGADTMYGGIGGYGGGGSYGSGADTFHLRDEGDRIMDGGEGDVVLSWIDVDDQSWSRSEGSLALVRLMGDADLDARSYAERIVGNAGDNHLRGGGVLEGGEGNDVLESTLTPDPSFTPTASYESASRRVLVDLSVDGAQDTRGAGVDTLIGIRRVIGSAFDDVLSGTFLDDQLEGGNGDDRVNGRGGVDTASYAGAQAGVAVDLSTTRAQDTGGAGVDILLSIERLIGSAHADRLLGGKGDNELRGGAGGDTLSGLLGNDMLYGDAGDDLLNGGVGYDYLIGGDGADRFVFDGVAPDPGSGWTADRIGDFDAKAGDVIDLSGIDADATLEGDQAFTIVSAFTGRAGELVVGFHPDHWMRVAGDLDGDGDMDFMIGMDAGAPVPDAALVL